MANKKTKEDILVESLIERENEANKKQKSKDLKLVKDFIALIKRTEY